MRISNFLPTLLLLTACDTTPIVQTKIIDTPIALQTRPKPVSMIDVKFYVVTKDNINDFLNTLKLEQGEDKVFYAISVKDYENIAINISELRRFILQQTELIVYYENSIKKPVDK